MFIIPVIEIRYNALRKLKYQKGNLPSKGLTVNAAVEPATQPARNDVQKTASPLPSFLRGPRAFKRANKGKYTTEKLTSRNIVAAVPLYSPAIPRVRRRLRAIDVADCAATVPSPALFEAKI